MNAIAVINPSPLARRRIDQDVLSKARDNGREFKYVTDPDEIFEFLSYGMPEIVLIDFSNRNTILDNLLKAIEADPWLNSFAVIGLFDEARDGEEEVLSRAGGINLISALEYADLGANLMKTVSIISENRQIIFQRDLTSRLLERMNGSFEIENDPYAVACYAGMIAVFLYNNGYLDRKNKEALFITLTEMIMNGIEHGNCGITFEEKSRHLENAGEMTELIAQKLRDPRIAATRVRLEYSIRRESSDFLIRDQGCGFDWKNLKSPLDGDGVLRLHGRGIHITRHLVRDLRYNDRGNEVRFTLVHQFPGGRSVPLGFAEEKILQFKEGDTVFTQGEESDYLYYISSGKYGVYHFDKKVGALSPADIFMGEMSFLLDNRRTATVRAETDGALVKISKRAFMAAIKKYPQYGVYLSRMLAQKLVRTNERAVIAAGNVVS